MPDLDDPNTPDSFADLPLQPTGSGVADLEIAYEQMKVAEDAEGADADALPTERPGDAAETEAHPS